MGKEVCSGNRQCGVSDADPRHGSTGKPLTRFEKLAQRQLRQAEQHRERRKAR